MVSPAGSEEGKDDFDLRAEHEPNKFNTKDV